MSLTIEQIARATYEANKVYCEAIGDETLPFEQVKEGVMKGVAALIRDPSLTPEEQHKLWVQDKLNQGWTWGPNKDAEKKTHPQLVHYTQLPEEQRLKDYLFQGIVRALARLPKGYVTA